MTVAVFRHRKPLPARFHVEIAPAHIELAADPFERHFIPEKRQHEIGHMHAALVARDLRPDFPDRQNDRLARLLRRQTRQPFVGFPGRTPGEKLHIG